MANRKKTLLVDALRNDHHLKDLLHCVKMSRSSYFYQHARLLAEDKHKEMKGRIGAMFGEYGGRYGYRRVHALLLREGRQISGKIVQRIITENALVVVGRKKTKHSSYQGENAPSARNLLKRDFRADAPNAKWLTDITEFRIPAGKIGLSIDCFDGMLANWTIGASTDAELVSTMLDTALKPLMKMRNR